VWREKKWRGFTYKKPRYADIIITLEEIKVYRDKEKIYKSGFKWTLKVKPLEEVLKIFYISALVSSTMTRIEILKNKGDAFNSERVL
jgi:hypothetical protein